MIRKQHRINLEKLATHLESLPDNYNHFDMSWYVKDINGHILSVESKDVTACGTVACALGHGPAAGVKVPDEVYYWDSYQDLFIRDAYTAKRYTTTARLIYGSDFLFDSEWVSYDNTVKGAAARIRHYLKVEGKITKADLPWN